MNTKAPNNYIAEATDMEVRMRKIHPARTYQMALRSEMSDLSRRLRELATQNQIANFLIHHSDEEMHQLIDNVAREIRNAELNY